MLTSWQPGRSENKQNLRRSWEQGAITYDSLPLNVLLACPHVCLLISAPSNRHMIWLCLNIVLSNFFPPGYKKFPLNIFKILTKYSYHKIYHLHHFKIHSSVMLSTYRLHHQSQNSSSYKTETRFITQLLTPLLPQPQVTPILLSFSINLTTWGNSCKWNHTVCVRACVRTCARAHAHVCDWHISLRLLIF